MYWYVVVSGTLEMMHVDPRDEKKVPLPHVGEGEKGSGGKDGGTEGGREGGREGGEGGREGEE